MDRDDLKALILECLAIHEDRKPKRKSARKPKAAGEPLIATDPTGPHIYALSHVWLECIGAVNIGRMHKALAPLLALYSEEWIAAGIRAYATEMQRTSGVRYASVENFASRATAYILPNIPNNALTEKEAALLGPEMVSAREHATVMGLLTERARGD